LFFSSNTEGEDAMSFKHVLVEHREKRDGYEKYAAWSEGIWKATAGFKQTPQNS
jgi:hypothetical protein